MEINNKKRLISLDPREYEHPLDREALNKLESIPGVKPLFQKIYKEIIEKFDNSETIYKVYYSSSPNRFLKDISNYDIIVDTTSPNWKVK